MPRRKSKAVIHDDTHRWIVSYADFITLLFAFFVVMYAISSINVSKYKSIAEGMHSAFDAKNTGKALVIADTTQKGQSERKGPTVGKDKFNELIKALAGLQDSDYHMNPQDGYVELDIKAGALFDSGSADMRPLAIIKLMKLASIIQSVPYPIAIEGYTDNMPIETSQYPSNWELSADRAAAVARWLSSFGVQQNRMSVTGYGEQYPIEENTSDEGRSRNRRVNVIIAKDKTVPRLANPAISVKENKESTVIQPKSLKTPTDSSLVAPPKEKKPEDPTKISPKGEDLSTEPNKAATTSSETPAETTTTNNKEEAP